MLPRWNENRHTASIDYPVTQGPLGGLPARSREAIAYAIEQPVEVEVYEMVIRPTVRDF